MAIFRHLWRSTLFQTPGLQQLSRQADALSRVRWMPWILFGLGLLRAVVSLLAYPPAHGADSFAYLFYAERLAGLEIPGLSQLVPPLYPLFLLAAGKWLGSYYWLIGLQALMSAALVPLYYLALRKHHAVLALLAALVILFDFQTAVMFNFLSTEPLYIFLLAVLFYLFMRQASLPGRSPSAGDALTGLIPLLLMLTRAVSRFLIIPQLVLFWLFTRSWKRTLVMAGGFVVSLAFYSLVSQLFLGGVEGTTSSDYMVTGVVLRNQQWLQSENGAASAEFITLQTACQGQKLSFYDCYYAQRGTWDGMLPLIINTVIETVGTNWLPYVRDVWQRTNDFLSLSGQQLGIDPGLPSEIQCDSAEAIIAGLTPDVTHNSGWGWTWGIRGYVENNFEDFRARYAAMRRALCPPLSGSAAVKEVVDYLTFRYRSLGRPQPYLYYGALIGLIHLLPWARRFRLPLYAAGGILLYHALISAVINNVQPRYVMVVNPFRAILLTLLAVIVIRLGLLLLDGLFARRAAALTLPDTATDRR